MSEQPSKSVLLLITVDDGTVMVNAPDKPPRVVKSLDDLVAFIQRPDVKAAKSMPALSIGDVFEGLGRMIAGSVPTEGEQP